MLDLNKFFDEIQGVLERGDKLEVLVDKAEATAKELVNESDYVVSEFSNYYGVEVSLKERLDKEVSDLVIANMIGKFSPAVEGIKRSKGEVHNSDLAALVIVTYLMNKIVKPILDGIKNREASRAVGSLNEEIPKTFC